MAIGNISKITFKIPAYRITNFVAEYWENGHQTKNAVRSKEEEKCSRNSSWKLATTQYTHVNFINKMFAASVTTKMAKGGYYVYADNKCIAPSILWWFHFYRLLLSLIHGS